MSTGRRWWVACKEWVDSDPYPDEATAKARAEELTTDSHPIPHFYWEADEHPTASTLTGINIPEGAHRVP